MQLAVRLAEPTRAIPGSSPAHGTERSRRGGTRHGKLIVSATPILCQTRRPCRYQSVETLRRPGGRRRRSDTRAARADLARHGRHLGRTRRDGSPRPRRGAGRARARPPTRTRPASRSRCPTHPDFAVALLRGAARRPGRRAGQPRLHRAGAAARAGRLRRRGADRRRDRTGDRRRPPGRPARPGRRTRGTAARPRGRRRPDRARTSRCCSTPRAPRAGRRARCSPTGALIANHEQVGADRAAGRRPRRRRAAGAAALPRVRAQLRASARSPTTAPAGCWSTASTRPTRSTLIARHRRHRASSACRRCTSPGRCCPTCGEAMASVRLAVCGAAPLDPADRGALHRGDPAPGLRRVRPDRDRAGA